MQSSLAYILSSWMLDLDVCRNTKNIFATKRLLCPLNKSGIASNALVFLVLMVQQGYLSMYKTLPNYFSACNLQTINMLTLLYDRNVRSSAYTLCPIGNQRKFFVNLLKIFEDTVVRWFVNAHKQLLLCYVRFLWPLPKKEVERFLLHYCKLVAHCIFQCLEVEMYYVVDWPLF